jgi:hypothetical protein
MQLGNLLANLGHDQKLGLSFSRLSILVLF